ncbi:MAG: phosphate ABC transporter permease subunit PstC [Acidimicrobiales bacterium]|nr:phosphate ABC transporter permease subunit PstC [Acidimicrobiales bacterium]
MSMSHIAASSVGVDPGPRRSLEAASPRHGEKLIKIILGMCATVSVLVTTAIVVSLLVPSVNLFREVSIREFLTGTQWAPAFANPTFGVLPIVVGTLMVVVFAMVVAVPIGLASAIYLSEYASRRVRKLVKPVLEVLEGIPTVAFGIFAFSLLTPTFQDLLPGMSWRGPFSIGVAGITVGLLIVPLVASVSDDAMRAVPADLRQGAYALGASRMKVAVRVVIPAAISGIVAAFVLAVSRAIGETMVVVIVAGAGDPTLSFDPFQGAQTMTAYIAGRATGDIAAGTIVYDTIFAVGALLFIMTFAMNMLAIRLVRRFREAYE